MRICKMLESDSPTARMCLRIIANCFPNEISRSHILDFRAEFIPLFTDILTMTDEKEISAQVEIAIGKKHALKKYDQFTLKTS